MSVVLKVVVVVVAELMVMASGECGIEGCGDGGGADGGGGGSGSG